MKIKTISNFSYMDYKYYLNQQMQMIEQRLNMNNATNPQLINSVKREIDHSLVGKYIFIPFNGK